MSTLNEECLPAQPSRHPHEPLKSAHFPDDHRVLEGWPRRRPGPDPAFGELRWDLTAAIDAPNMHPGDRMLDFSRIADPVRQITAMEFMAARLCKRVPATRLLKPSGAAQHLILVSRFTAFLDEEHGGCAYAEVTQDILGDYLRWCGEGRYEGRPGPKDQSLVSYVRAVKLLWEYRRWFTHDSLEAQPWGTRRASQVCKAKHNDENTTQRIPEAVIAALLRWALFYLDTAAQDILAARDEHEFLGSRKLAYTSEVAVERLTELFARRRAAGRGLPGRRPDSPAAKWRIQGVDRNVNMTLLCRLAGLDRSVYMPRKRGHEKVLQLIQDGVDELGLEPGGYDTPITVCENTGWPWREPFDSRRITEESNHLLAACYIVVAYLSGMRDSEVQGLERRCHFTEPTNDGVLVRHKLRGWVVKGRRSKPRRANWVVLPEVARAVEILEMLTDQDLLFIRPGNSGQVPASEIVQMINDFAEHVNMLAERTGLPPIRPVTQTSIDGETTTEAWWFTTRQFRRTMAWHIARQPFGLVAGKIQYQQTSVAIFEGYAGTSESGFRAEVEKERAEAQLDDIVERYEDDMHGRPFTGGAAARLKSDFARIRAELGDFPVRRADRARVREMLRGMARTYRVGVLADCAFDESNPDKAVCVSDSIKAHKTKQILPILDACQPANCANACQSEKHRDPWRRMVAEVDEHLKDKKLNDVQRQVLLRQRKAWQGLLDRLQSAEDQETA